jgi:hypothetical protein
VVGGEKGHRDGPTRKAVRRLASATELRASISLCLALTVVIPKGAPARDIPIPEAAIPESVRRPVIRISFSGAVGPIYARGHSLCARHRNEVK